MSVDTTTCPDCDGAGEVGVCANDGTHGCSHQYDREWTCNACDGSGVVGGTTCPGGGFDYDGQGCPRGICALCERDASAHDPDFQPGLS